MQPKIEVDVFSADAALIIQQGCHFTENLDLYFSTQGIYQNQLKYLLHRQYTCTCNTGMFLIVAKCYNSLWLCSKFFEMRLFHQVEVFGWLGVICYFYVKRKNTEKATNTGKILENLSSFRRGNPEQQKFSFT